MLAEIKVAHQSAKRSPAKDTVLFLIDLLVECTLVKLRSLFYVAKQLLLRGVEDANLKAYAGFAVVHQVLQSAPRAFQLLETRMVQNFVQLKRKQVIDLRDTRVDHHLCVFRNGHGA